MSDLDLAALERALAGSAARPLLLDERLVRRVIKRHLRLPGFGPEVPHARCYAVDRASLLAIVPADELGRAAADLPEEVILLPRPEPEDLAGKPPAEIITHLWRYAFHARVHLEIDRRAREGKLTEARLRDRAHRIGQTEFDEIRLVLRQDGLLLPPRDARATYAELAATFLELSRFAPARLRETFPGLDHAVVEDVLAGDVDAGRLLAECRPEGAPEAPWIASDPPREIPSDPAEEGAGDRPRGTLRGEADEARRLGNVVRSAIARLKLAHAGAGDAEAARAEARADLAALSRRLDAALRPPAGGAGIDRKAWEAILLALADRAARRGVFLWVEARLLYDLQRACLASERAIGKVDLVDWAQSLGKRPLARLLPATRPIRVAREIAAAAKKIPLVDLDPAARARLEAAIAGARRRADDNIRDALRPVVREALLDVGLRPEGVPERVALQKVVEDLLDHATTHGHLGLGVLRDALSRNQLKLADLSGASELWSGDALLLADQRLSRSLEGVHRRGEIYLRSLQKLSSLLFGTRPGRFLTLYLLLPFGSSFVILEGLGHMATPLGHLLKILPRHHHVHLFNPTSWIATTVALFALIHSALVRSALTASLRAVGRALAAVFFHAPRWILSRPLVRRVLASRAVTAIGRYVIKPASVTAAAAYLTPIHADLSPATVAAGAAIFITTNLALNSRAGALVEEITLDYLARTVRRLARHVLPGLFRLVVDTFRAVSEAIDQGIYAVDEWLRFREGQSRAVLAAKAVLGVIWFAIAYLARIYVNLLIEPQINPIKHFPVVTVAAKIMLPLSPTLIPAFHSVLARAFGHLVANTLAAPTILLLPGVAGFLVWEFKENYKLYRATRAAHLAPVPIGHHGETMRALLTPGLHSGTIPKLWSALRRAARKGEARAEKFHHQMREISEAIARFAERDAVALLAASPAWEAGPVRVAKIDLASNRVRIHLARGDHHDAPGDPDPVVISFEEQSGWILAGVQRIGWAASLAPTERVIFENALAGLYALAGVDLVREQIAAAIPGSPPYDLSSEGLVVWPGDRWATELVYSLEARGEIAPAVRGDPFPSPPRLDPARLLYTKQPIAWSDWVKAWSSGAPERVIKGAPLLPAS